MQNNVNSNISWYEGHTITSLGKILKFAKFYVQNIWQVVRWWHHQLTHLHIHIDWSRNVLWKFAKLQSDIHNFLIFQPIFIRFSLLCLEIFTLSSEIKINLLWSSSLINKILIVLAQIQFAIGSLGWQILSRCTVRAPVFDRHQFFGTSEHYGKTHGSLSKNSGWMNIITLHACCWFPASGSILILPSQFWQIGFESYWLHCSKCRILVLLQYVRTCDKMKIIFCHCTCTCTCT